TYTYDGRGVRIITSYPSYFLATVSVGSSTLYTNQSTTGTVTLGGPAAAGGATVQLLSSSPSLLVPNTVTIPEGGTSGLFGVTQVAGAHAGSVTITATYGFTRTVSISLAAGPALASIAVTPATVVGGANASATVTLTAAAPTGGAPVSLSSDS